MQLVVLAGLLIVLGATFTWTQVRSARSKADAAVDSFAAPVPAALTPKVAAWVRPQLLRRTLYSSVGGTWGVVLANLFQSPDWSGVPWYLFATVVGGALGASVGTLVAGLRTEPLVDGPTRVVDPVRRSVTTHFDHARVLQLRLGLIAAAGGLVLAGAVAWTSGSGTARAALVACCVGAAVVAADLWLVASVLSRPMVSSSSEGLVWQRALVAATLKPFPQNSSVTGVGTAAVALYATIVDRDDLPLAVLGLAGTVLAMAVVCVAVLVVADGIGKQRPRAGCVDVSVTR